MQTRFEPQKGTGLLWLYSSRAPDKLPRFEFAYVVLAAFSCSGCKGFLVRQYRGVFARITRWLEDLPRGGMFMGARNIRPRYLLSLGLCLVTTTAVAQQASAKAT